MNQDFIKIYIQNFMEDFHMNSPSYNGKFSKKSKVLENQFYVQYGLSGSKVAYTSMEFYILEESRKILEIMRYSWLCVPRVHRAHNVIVLTMLLSISFSLF